MKILHICGYTVERGGGSKVVYDHSKYQAEQGHEVSILSVDFTNEQPYPVPNGVSLIHIKNHWLGRFIPDFSAESFSFFKNNSNSYDIIQIHGIWFWTSVVPFFYKTSAKRIYTIHGMLSEWTLKQGAIKKKIFGKLLQDRCLRKADAIFALTSVEKQEIITYQKNISQDKIIVIPNAVFAIKPILASEKQKLKEKLKLNNLSKIVLFLSRIHKKKGVELLIEAFAKLPKNQDILIIAGPDDGEVPMLKALISQLNLGDRVLFTGSVSGREKEVLFSISDVYALISYSEGFPMAVLEAMEVGVPVVVSNQTRIDYFIDKYDAGNVTDLNISTISKALFEILNDAQLAEKYVTNGKIMLEKEFKPENIFNKTLLYYLELLKN